MPLGSVSVKKLAASIHEGTGFLFYVRPEATIRNPRLDFQWIDPGAETVSAGLSRVLPVPVPRYPGWHVRSIHPAERQPFPLDVLVPLDAPKGGMPSRLDAGGEYAFWAEFVPGLGTPPGTTKAAIVLQSAGKRLGTLNVELTVWPLSLPDRGDLMAVGELDYVGLFRHHFSGPSSTFNSAMTWHNSSNAERFNTLLFRTIRLLQEHRVAALLPDLRPAVKVSPRGELELDWGHYDAVAATLLNGKAFSDGVPLSVWLLPLHAVESSADGATFTGPGSRELARRYLIETAKHFEERGWLDRSIALINRSTIPTRDGLALESNLAGWIREARPDVRIASRRFPQDMEPYGWYGFTKGGFDTADVWMPDAQFYETRAMAAERNGGREAWLSVDRPPFSGSTAIHARPGDLLSLSWQAGRLEAERLWLGPINQWPTEGLPVAPEVVIGTSPHALLFPGAAFGLEAPVPTLRLKRVRETMQHAAYVRLLEQHGRQHIADALRSAIVEYAGTAAYRTHFADGRRIGWPAEERVYENARRIMAMEIAGREAFHESSILGADLLWRSVMNPSNRVRLMVDGTRVRLTGTPIRPRYRVEAWYTVANSTRETVRGTVNIVGIPVACDPTDVRQPIDLPGSRSQRGSLTIECEAGWLAATSKELTLRFERDDGSAIETPARVSMIIAEPTPRPLEIDGDLSDWVASAGNVASDFRLIAGVCDDPGRTDCDRPTLATVAFARRDAEHLYLAINAQAHPDPGTEVRRSTVRYDDLIPMDDDDLVEILVDPLNGGTRSPSDLYHIAIKRSGVYLVERGITTDPPLGPRVPWQASVAVASRSQKDRWTAEIRIPFSAFQRHGSVQGEIWGLNVTHSHAERQEFSNWSGAVGNAYDPLSLGNLLLP